VLIRESGAICSLLNDPGPDTYPTRCEPARENRRISSRAIVAIVQTAQSQVRNHSTGRRRADSSARSFLAQPKMRSAAMIVRDVLGQKPPEMTLVQGDDVVQQLTSAAANPAFRNTVLPGCRSPQCKTSQGKASLKRLPILRCGQLARCGRFGCS